MTKQNPTLADVAQRAGVSQMTASRALNGRPGVSRETRDEVMRIAADIGYVVNRTAQKLSGGRNGIIGIMTPALDTEFSNELILCASRAARAAGCEVLVYTVSDDTHSHQELIKLVRQFSDGLLVILPRETLGLDALAAAHVPVVVIDQRGTLNRFPSVSVDNYGGACMAVEHLIALGHTRIAFLGGDESIEGLRDRQRGYHDTLARHGLARDAALAVSSDPSKTTVFEAASGLLKLPDPPSAIFAANDQSAFGAIAAVREAGLRVPDDISVVGFDDIPMSAQFHPALTTVRQPFQQMSSSAVNALLAQIAGNDAVAQRTTFPAELVVRHSTAPAPQRANEAPARKSSRARVKA